MQHLTVRVAWHDSRWTGTICKDPLGNPYCITLKNIHEKRRDQQEQALADTVWADLADEQLPPCIAEGAGFMSAREWHRVFNHPYQQNKNAAATHGHLLPTTVKVPPLKGFHLDNKAYSRLVIGKGSVPRCELSVGDHCRQLPQRPDPGSAANQRR